MRGTILSLFVFFAATGIGAQPMPADSIPRQWSYSSDMFQTLPAADEWWNGFGDSLLDSLISIGIDNNFDVAIAARRMEMARQSIRQAKAGYYPQLSLSAGWTKSRSSGNMSSPSGPVENLDYFSAGIDMAWEIDVFGRINSQVKEKKAAYNASRADYLAAMNTLCAEIATEYLQLRTWQAQLDVARTHLESQQQALKIAEARHEAGLNSSLDVAQAQTVYYSTASTIPTLEADITTAVNALSLLLGEYPEQLQPLLTATRPLPDYRKIVAIGVPMDLLRRRPDVREAEYEMAVAAAEMGIAKKDFLPTLSLDGSIGVASHRIGDLFDNHSLTYSIAPKLSWTIFDGMARNASLASARENMQMAIDSYNLAVMTAYNEASNAMTSYTSLLRRIDSLEQVVDAARRELNLSLDLYKQGLDDFLSVAQAQITLLQYTDELQAARGSAATALVSIYKALGGGWQYATDNQTGKTNK